MRALRLGLLLWALGLWLAAPVLAHERILAYDSTVQINADGSMDVEERIRVRAEGQQIRRGIYRDFPTRYKNRYGNRVVVDFDVKEVLRDGRPEPWFTEKRGNGVRLNTGDERFLAVPAEITYTLRYRTHRQLGFFAGHDELYWNAIGTGWVFPIESGRVDVRLPQAVAESELAVEGYSGPQGAKGQDYVAQVTGPGQASWRLTRELAPREGLTLVLSFPKGVVAAPSSLQRVRWLLQDNRGVLLALVGGLMMLALMVRRWYTVGRDPRAGVIIARYEPPDEHTPASLRFVQRMGHDTRTLTADVLALAVGGWLRIHHGSEQTELLRFKRQDQWRLQRLETGQGEPMASQQVLLQALFRDGPGLELKQENHRLLGAAVRAHAQSLEASCAGRYFHRNFSSVAMAAALGAVTLFLAFRLQGDAGQLVLIVIGVLMLASLFVFHHLVRAPTVEGRRLLDEIEGLKLYLSVAERDELASLQGPAAVAEEPPPLNAERYQRLLPYAVALDVEEAWTQRFTLAVGAAAAAAAGTGVGWYRSDHRGDLNSLSQSLGKGLSAQIAASASAPGSSSGGGGGGSSGGGGGGGGGGGR